MFWVLFEGVVASVLLIGGGLAALQAASVSTGLPFAIRAASGLLRAGQGPDGRTARVTPSGNDRCPQAALKRRHGPSVAPFFRIRLRAKGAPLCYHPSLAKALFSAQSAPMRQRPVDIYVLRGLLGLALGILAVVGFAIWRSEIRPPPSRVPPSPQFTLTSSENGRILHFSGTVDFGLTAALREAVAASSADQAH